MIVRVGMYYENYGVSSFEIPDSFKDATDEEIQAYVKEHADEVPIPFANSQYVEDSEDIDFESCFERV